MENPNNFSQHSALNNPARSRGASYGGAADPVDPAAFDRDIQHKEKLLKKWERYFPHESQQ